MSKPETVSSHPDWDGRTYEEQVEWKKQQREKGNICSFARVLYHNTVYHLPLAYPLNSDRTCPIDGGIGGWWTYHFSIEEANKYFAEGFVLP